MNGYKMFDYCCVITCYNFVISIYSYIFTTINTYKCYKIINKIRERKREYIRATYNIITKWVFSCRKYYDFETYNNL